MESLVEGGWTGDVSQHLPFAEVRLGGSGESGKCSEETMKGVQAALSRVRPEAM